MSVKIPQLVFSIGICLMVGFVSSFFTVSAIPTWYASLVRPSFAPPNWVFAPVWTVLYVMMGVALYLVVISNTKHVIRRKAITIFAIQLALNAVWSIIFFGLRNPLLAFVDIIALWIAIIVTIRYFYSINKFAGWLLLPYLLWVSFASMLSLTIVLLN